MSNSVGLVLKLQATVQTRREVAVPSFTCVLPLSAGDFCIYLQAHVLVLDLFTSSSVAHAVPVHAWKGSGVICISTDEHLWFVMMLWFLFMWRIHFHWHATWLTFAIKRSTWLPFGVLLANNAPVRTNKEVWWQLLMLLTCLNTETFALNR